MKRATVANHEVHSQRRFAREEKVKEYHLGRTPLFSGIEALADLRCEKGPTFCLRISITATRAFTHSLKIAKTKIYELWQAWMRRRSSLCTTQATWLDDTVSSSIRCSDCLLVFGYEANQITLRFSVAMGEAPELIRVRA